MSTWTPKISSVPMTELCRPLRTETARTWGIDVAYGPTSGSGSSERAVMVLDGRTFDVVFDLGEEGETIGTERGTGKKFTMTEAITVRVDPV
jgi:hypothetical protein